MLGLGFTGDFVERILGTSTHVSPALRREFADAAEVLLIGVVELLCEPYVGAVDHEGIGGPGYVFLAATATVSRAARSSIAAKQNVHGGAILDDFVESRVELLCDICATIRTLRYRTSGATTQSCDWCGRRGTHTEAGYVGRDEPEGRDGLRKRDGRNREERGNRNGLRGIGNVAEQVTISVFTEPETIAETITCTRS
jgi:hypothetical protein